MIDFRLGRHALAVCVGIVMLTGCDGWASDDVVPIKDVPNSYAYHKTFNYTGAKHYFKVPTGVTQITVSALGAHGAGSTEAYGGRVHAVIPVTPGETLVVLVGGDASRPNGGFNGGANGGDQGAYGGGGASDVRQGGDKLADRILVAGGGGGQGGSAYEYPGGLGGKGGGRFGGSGETGESGDGSGGGGGGGKRHSGGSGGSGGNRYENPGSDGTLGDGGVGGTGCSLSSCGYGGGSGGGGGGGYYGGGGGGTGDSSESQFDSAGGGGGGGSSYAEHSATNVHMWRGWKASTHNGLVVFSW